MLSARARCLAVWWATTLTLLGLAQVVLPTIGDLPVLLDAPVRFDEVLVALCAVVALATAGWLWLVVTLLVVEVLRRGSSRGRGLPAAVRPLVLAACGLTLAGGLVAPATAQPSRPMPAPVGTPVPSAAALLSGLPLPDRPLSRSAAVRDRDDTKSTVVRPGDSLWQIAARMLPPDATTDAVSTCWQRIHARNRERIGPDPDLIHPGQRLHLPEC